MVGARYQIRSVLCPLKNGEALTVVDPLIYVLGQPEIDIFVNVIPDIWLVIFHEIINPEANVEVGEVKLVGRIIRLEVSFNQ